MPNKMDLKGKKVMPIDVYRSPKIGNCTNGGISGKVDTLYLIHKQGFLDADKVPREQVVIEEQRGPNYFAVKQIDEPDRGIGPMDGGNLAYSCDSRIAKVYHVHDRFESVAEYERLSV